MLVAIGLGSFLANRIMKPIRSLISASREVSNGNFAPEIGPQSKDEIGVLQKTFAEMLSSLRERDKDQRVQSEIRLLQSEKQASVGRLAAGVAHEINNPLTGVLTFTHMLLRRKDINEEIRADLTTIAKATERVRTIVKGLLDFSRQTMLAPEPTDINELVSSAVKLVENNALVKGVKLSFKPMEGLPVRRVDRSAMQGVLLNIIMNALDATGAGGSILVTTNLGYFAKTTEEKTIEISVIDTGHGIPPKTWTGSSIPSLQPRMWAKGRAWASPSPRGLLNGMGAPSTFRAPWARGAPSLYGCRWGMKVKGRKILVVDDDPIVLESCRRILEPEGYPVVCVPSADDAFDNLEMGYFDLMIMDIKMPQQDGFYLLGKVKEKWPLGRFLELPVLVMTGYPTQETLRELRKSGRSPVHPEALHAGRAVGGSTKNSGKE